jgi:hypothetical protein
MLRDSLDREAANRELRVYWGYVRFERHISYEGGGVKCQLDVQFSSQKPGSACIRKRFNTGS